MTDGNDKKVKPASIQKIEQAFIAKNWKYKIIDIEPGQVIDIAFTTDNLQLHLAFVGRNANDFVSVRAFSFIKAVPAEKKLAMLKAFNQLHTRFNFVRFMMDDDGDIPAAYDFPECEKDIGSAAAEIALRLSNIISDAYPDLMRARWN